MITTRKPCSNYPSQKCADTKFASVILMLSFAEAYGYGGDVCKAAQYLVDCGHEKAVGSLLGDIAEEIASNQFNEEIVSAQDRDTTKREVKLASMSMKDDGCQQALVTSLKGKTDTTIYVPDQFYGGGCVHEFFIKKEDLPPSGSITFRLGQQNDFGTNMKFYVDTNEWDKA